MLAILIVGLCAPVQGQQTYTKNQGFPATYQPGGPATNIDGSVQIPGLVETNSGVRFVDTSGNTCLWRDEVTEQIWSEIDCDGVYEGAPDEFFLGSGGAGGGIGKVITDASSEATGFVVGNGTNRFTLWCDGSQCYLQCMLDDEPCDPRIIIPTGKTLQIENEAGTTIIAIDSDFAVTLTGNAKEAHSAWVSAGAFSTDGTQCAAPSEATFGSNKMWTAVCASNNASRLMYTLPMDFLYDGGPLIVTAYVTHAGPTPSGDYDIDWSIACAGVLSDNNFGTEVATDFDFDASGSCGGAACLQHAEVRVTSAALTAPGTCQPGGVVRLRGEIDATGTTATASSVHVLGVRIRRVADDWSE